MDEAAISRKLGAARTRLILDQPFLGALVLRLPLTPVQQDWCPTTATDARRFYYNPAYIAALDPAQVQFMLAHEALHCALSHFARRQHRLRQRWDVACDHAINPVLIDEGLKPPPDSLFQDSFRGMTAEEIYPYIQDNADDTLDRHLYDGGTPQEQGGGETPDTDQGAGTAQSEHEVSKDATAPPPALNQSERDGLQVQWQQRLAGAAQQARQAGKLSGVMARLVDDLLQPRLSWRGVLARYMSALARDDYSYTRPSVRRGGPALFPRLRSEQIDIAIALDTSGSVATSELSAFLSEIDAIKSQMRARITLYACDTHLAADAPWLFEPWEPCILPTRLSGGGGTRFAPVFDALARCDRAPELLVYFTDACGEFPSHAPYYPVLWLVKGKAPVPWGERIQLND